MAEDTMLREAINALAQGQQGKARDLLTRLLRADQTNPTYWLYMSAVVETSKERIYCLQNVIRIDPENQDAQLGLRILGVNTPPPGLSPPPFSPRSWNQNTSNKNKLSTGKKIVRNLIYGGAGVFLVGLLLIGVIGPRLEPGWIFGPPRLTVTPQYPTQLATATLLPTNTPFITTPTPTFEGPTPLWMQLDITYTPTPLYVNTPHPISEAFRAGMRAFGDGKYKEMLAYMQQAARDEPEAADVHYYLGEAFRLLDQPSQAYKAYEQAIAVNPEFAPGYLGRARTNLTLKNTTVVETDLLRAIEEDQYLLEAYLDLAAYKLSIGEPELALVHLESAKTISPENPVIFQLRGEAYLVLKDYETALSASEKAFNLDQTSIPVYALLGQAYLETGDPENAKKFLDVYLSFVDGDANAWVAKGRSYFEIREFENAIKALSTGLELQDDLFQALLYRGLSYLELGEGQSAVNDLFEARKLNDESFQANLGLGRALLLTNRLVDAISLFNRCEELAADEREQAAVYYWRGIAREATGNYSSAASDWLALIILSNESVPEDWRSEVEEKLISLTPSPTATFTRQPGNSSTPSAPVTISLP
jgi:tetratricopeptide (TPR) repeat protein